MTGRRRNRVPGAALGLAAFFLAAALVLSGCSGNSTTRTTTTSTPGNTSTSTVPTTSITTSTGSSPSVANGQRIYFYATSDSGQDITYTGGPGMMGGVFACVTCHGADGHGGQVYIMMQSFDVPNITWPDLTGPDPDMKHPPYTEATLKRAITEGLDPGGSPLDYPMPRWQMSAPDLDDLVAFIKTLK